MEDESDEQQENTESNQFDAIIVGTSLVEAIVACAASRQGKRVLHIDHRDYYGGGFASFNLSSFLRDFPLPREADHRTSAELGGPSLSFTARPKDVIVVGGQDLDPNLAPFLSFNYSTRKFFHPVFHSVVNGHALDSCPSETPNSEFVHPAFFGLLTKDKQEAAASLTRDREFCVDTAVRIISSTGPFIDALISSGVSRYLEFKTGDSLFYLLPADHQGSSTNTIETKDGVSLASCVWRVPSSKNDIFNSKQLTAFEKRTMMKFHQFVSDWGRTTAGSDVTVLNENELAIGRSLYRPQNKSTTASALATEDNDKLRQQSFASFLQSYHLSAKLQQLIMFGLCHLSTDHASPAQFTAPLNAERGLQELSLHLNSLGRYGESAQLVPIYGLGEIVQGFCRMSAVWAGTYMLRYALKSIQVVDVEPNAAESKPEPVPLSDLSDAPEPAAVAVDEPPAGSSSTLETEPSRQVEVTGADDGQVYRAPRALLHYSFNPQSRCQPVFLLQGLFYYHGRPLLPAERALAMIPPNYTTRNATSSSPDVALENPCAVHVTQANASVCTVPEGVTLVQMQTYLPLSSSGADGEGVNDFAYSEWQEVAQRVKEQGRALIDRVRMFLESVHEDISQSRVALCHRILLRPVFHSAPPSTSDIDSNAQVLYSSDSGGFALHLNEAVEEATRLYQALFGAECELFPADRNDPQEDMQVADEDDDEVQRLYNQLTNNNNKSASGNSGGDEGVQQSDEAAEVVDGGDRDVVEATAEATADATTTSALTTTDVAAAGGESEESFSS